MTFFKYKTIIMGLVMCINQINVTVCPQVAGVDKLVICACDGDYDARQAEAKLNIAFAEWWSN